MQFLTYLGLFSKHLPPIFPNLFFFSSLSAVCTHSSPLLFTLSITTWIRELPKSNISWHFYFFPDNLRISEHYSFVYPLPTYKLLLSCIFILYMFKPHKTSLLFYNINILLYILTLFFLMCTLFFPQSPSFFLRPLSFSLKNTFPLATPCDHMGPLSGKLGTHGSVCDHGVCNQLLAFLRKWNIFQKIPVFTCVAISSLTYLVWSTLNTSDWKTYFDELWHRLIHAVIITRPVSSL